MRGKGASAMAGAVSERESFNVLENSFAVRRRRQK